MFEENKNGNREITDEVTNAPTVVLWNAVCAAGEEKNLVVPEEENQIRDKGLGDVDNSEQITIEIRGQHSDFDMHIIFHKARKV